MTTRRPRRFDVEGLEAREMLSGAAASVHAAVAAKGAVMPYVELTLKGNFVAGAPTTVTFAAKHEATVTVTPSAVTKTLIVVAVPAFFDAKSGQPVASTASVSVHQTVGGHTKSVQVLKSLSIARLPQTGLQAGDVLGAVTVAAATVTDITTTSLQNLAAAHGGDQIAEGILADLDEISLLIPQAQEQLVALATGSIASVPLGTYQGKPASLDSGQLGVLDRIVAGGIDAAAGTTSTGAGLVESLGGLIAGAVVAGPSAVVARAKDVIDVLSTAVGTPVVSPGSAVTGLAIGSLSAVVAAAEVEVLVIQGAFSTTSTLGPADLALVDQVLDDPALGQALTAITTGLVPSTPAGVALIEAAELAENLAAQIDPGIPGSAGSLFAAYLNSVPLHQG